MSDVKEQQDMRRILGIPVPFEYNGKTYQIGPWSFLIEGMFAAWVERRAVLRLDASRGSIGEDEYRIQRRELRQDIDKGMYEWGSDIVASAWQNPEGSRHIVYLTLHAIDPSVTPHFVQEMSRNKAVWKDLWGNILLPLNFPPEPAPKKEETEVSAAGLKAD